MPVLGSGSHRKPVLELCDQFADSVFPSKKHQTEKLQWKDSSFDTKNSTPP